MKVRRTIRLTLELKPQEMDQLLTYLSRDTTINLPAVEQIRDAIADLLADTSYYPKGDHNNAKAYQSS